jgi:hypothetical protein
MIILKDANASLHCVIKKKLLLLLYAFSNKASFYGEELLVPPQPPS